MDRPFRIGDVVREIGRETPMCVNGAEDDLVWCRWFSYRDLYEKYFSPSELVHLTEEEIDEIHDKEED